MKHLHAPKFFLVLSLVINSVASIGISQAQTIRQDWHRNMPVYPPANQSGARTVVDFNGDPYWAINNQDSATGKQYVWLEKRDTFATTQFSVAYLGTHGAEFTDLKIDGEGNTYLYGINYGGSNNGSNSIFLNKYNTIGTLQWSFNFDYDQNAEEIPDQIELSPLTGDIVIIATEVSPQQLLVAKFTSGGEEVWQKSFGAYEAGDILIDANDLIHLATTYHLTSEMTDDHFGYLLLNSNGEIVNEFNQAGGHYSYALHTGSRGRTVGVDAGGNFFCLAWVSTFPGDSTSWTHIMLYKFGSDGNQIWSKRLNRILTGYPSDASTLITDYETGKMIVVGGRGMWRYETDGSFLGGYYDSRRNFVDAMMFDRSETFALSSGNPLQTNDSGKITHFDWSDNVVAFYNHGRANIQYLNNTAIAEPDAVHQAMYVTFSYMGKISLHRLVLRNEIATSIDENSEPQNAIEIYPNPVSDVLNIAMNDNSNDQKLVQVCDLSGKIMMTISFQHEKNVQIPVSCLSAGMYQVIVTTASSRYAQKLVVQ